MKEKHEEQLQEIAGEELNQLERFNSPMQLLKKALSSFLIVLVIGAGFVINAIIALIFAFNSSGAMVWWQYTVSLLVFLAVFPAVYSFLAVSYTRSVVIWEAYREILRPLAAKLLSKTLDTYLVEDPSKAAPIDEESIVRNIEQRQKHLLEKLPDFLLPYVQIFFTAKDVVTIVKAQRTSGAEKEAVKRKALESLFESIDSQVAELTEPSLVPFGIVAVVNIVVVYFLF